jgi:histidine triad (HIT) family protein
MIMTCLFCNIANKIIPTNLLFENEVLIAFRDINPQAASHFLIVPKEHIATINDSTQQHENLLGRMVLKARDLAIAEGINDEGYRLVFNVNAAGGQTVYHIHLHVLGGRQMLWPPG